MQTLTLYADGCLTILLKGELDHCAAQDAMQSIEELAEEYLPRRCVLDLSGLTFMDSSGIAVILKADRLLRQSGASLALERPPQQVRKVLEVAGLTQVIPLCRETEEECEPC